MNGVAYSSAYNVRSNITHLLRILEWLSIKAMNTQTDFHLELGKDIWDSCSTTEEIK